jgi:hypothetical protein
MMEIEVKIKLMVKVFIISKMICNMKASFSTTNSMVILQLILVNLVLIRTQFKII